MKASRSFRVSLLAAIFLVGCDAQEPFTPHVTDTRRALGEGKFAEVLAYHEQKARETEQAALTGKSAATN